MSPLSRAFAASSLLAAVAVSLAPAAAAAPTAPAVTTAVTTSPATTIVGDVTGDGLRDRVTLADVGTTDQAQCVALVRKGQGGGGLAAPVRVALTITANDEPGALQGCPETGVFLAGARPGLNRIALQYGGVLAQYRANPVFDLTGRALSQPSVAPVSTVGNGVGRIGTVDLDGDGNADWWQTGTDQGEGATLQLRTGDTFRRLYSTGYAPGVTLQFFDLNHNAGTDALVTTTTDSINEPFAAVVDGRTGAVQTLAKGSYYSDPPVYGYSLSVVDLDHDGLPDLQLTTSTDPGTTIPARTFDNRSAGGRWYFAEVTAPTRS